VLVVGVVGGLLATGEGDSIREIISSADSYKAMMWASLLSVIVAVAMSVGQRILTLEQAIDAWYVGMKAMLLAIVILVLAWALSGVNDVLGTADFLVSSLSDTLAPAVVPTLVFVLAAADGVRHGLLLGDDGDPHAARGPARLGRPRRRWPTHGRRVLATSSTPPSAPCWPGLSGATTAPRSRTRRSSRRSPPSATTSITSGRSSRTRSSWAAWRSLLGTLPAGFGAPWWMCMPICAAVLLAALRFFGKPVEGDAEPTSRWVEETVVE
jgi:hypothetical protein